MKMGSDRDSRKSKLNRRLVAYAVAAGGTVAAGQIANAVLQHRSINEMVYDDELAVDINDDGVDDFGFVHIIEENDGLSFFAGVEGLFDSNSIIGPGALLDEGGKASVLQGSRFITSDSPGYHYAKLASHVEGSFGLGYWAGQSGYLGVKFDIEGQRHFGFIGLSVNEGNDPGAELKINIGDAFWNDVPGQEVHVIPEPVGVGLLALGAVGIAAMGRRRRTSRDKAEA